MARAEQHKARKDFPESGIVAGQTYYQWGHRIGSRFVTYRSLTPPTRQQLTQFEFMISVYDLDDRLQALSAESSFEDIRSEVESICEAINSLGEEQDEKYSNMPEGLQQSSSGELLQERAEGCNDWKSDLEAVDLEYDDDSIRSNYIDNLEDAPDELTDEQEQEVQAQIVEQKERLLEELQGCSYNGS